MSWRDSGNGKRDDAGYLGYHWVNFNGCCWLSYKEGIRLEILRISVLMVIMLVDIKDPVDQTRLISIHCSRRPE